MTASNPVVWEEPRNARRAKGTPAIFPNQMEELKENPNRWGRIGEFNRPTVAGTCCAQLYRGEGGIGSDDIANWEFRAERFDDDTSKLFAKYVGRGHVDLEDVPAK